MPSRWATCPTSRILLSLVATNMSFTPRILLATIHLSESLIVSGATEHPPFHRSLYRCQYIFLSISDHFSSFSAFHLEGGDPQFANHHKESLPALSSIASFHPTLPASDICSFPSGKSPKKWLLYILDVISLRNPPVLQQLFCGVRDPRIYQSRLGTLGFFYALKKLLREALVDFFKYPLRSSNRLPHPVTITSLQSPWTICADSTHSPFSSQELELCLWTSTCGGHYLCWMRVPRGRPSKCAMHWLTFDRPHFLFLH